MISLILAFSLNLIPPIPGAVNVKDFYIPENKYASGHRGIDLLSLENSQVLAAEDGFISHSGLWKHRKTCKELKPTENKSVVINFNYYSTNK